MFFNHFLAGDHIRIGRFFGINDFALPNTHRIIALMSGIYIHIPFCRKACHYCNFHFSTSMHQSQDMVDAIISEIIIKAQRVDLGQVHTIYFGGGSPSVLTESNIEKILDTIHQHFNTSEVKEITLEANPEDMKAEYLSNLRNLGINRLSIGIQSFDDEELVQMNRIHNAQEAHKAIENAVRTGFKDFSIDLIYGSEWCTHDIWQQNVNYALSYQPTHISSYQLTIEDKTVFGHRLKKNQMSQVDDEKAVIQYNYLQDTLGQSGYHHYEISNFALPDHYALHNTNYWKGVPYIGVGPSAHSFLDGNRSWNLANNALYLKMMSEGIVPEEIESLTFEDKHNEYVMTSLRTMWGIDKTYFLERFGQVLLDSILHELDLPWYAGKIVQIDNAIVLTQEGKVFADRIASNLFI